MKQPLKFCLALFLLLESAFLHAEVWTESPIEFSKAMFADPTLPENQDRITATVWITRDDVAGIYNAFSESFFNNSDGPPAGTRWAFSGLDGNPAGSAFSASEHATLNFDTWENSLGSRGLLQTNIPNRPGVVHLIDDDIYIDITFTEWSSNSGGSFTYIRASAPAPAVPLPFPAYGLLIFSVSLLLIIKRKKY